MAAARAVGADRVELYTESYAAPGARRQEAACWPALPPRRRPRWMPDWASTPATTSTATTWTDFLRAVPGVQEVSIGHALIADALELGYDATVKAYLHCIAQAPFESCARKRQDHDLRHRHGHLRRAAHPRQLERHGERFARKVLSDAELATWQARSQRWPERGVRYLATRFSAKEAFSKAIGLGMRMPMTWRLCEIAKLPSGKPHRAAWWPEDVVRGAGPERPCQRDRRNRLRRQLLWW
jgi:holo-[acyl-carrier-protein] synthase